MAKNNSQGYPGYLTRELFLSPAFRELKPAAKDILILFYYEIRMKQKDKKGKESRVVTNKDEIKLTYRQIWDALKYSDKCIWESLKQILAHGFLKVVKYGGGAKGDVQVYGIREDWRKWTPGQVIYELRKNGKAGWQKSK